MSLKLLIEHRLEFVSLKGGSSESTLDKIPHCWKSRVTAQICVLLLVLIWYVSESSGLQISVHNWKLFFLFLNQNICCGYSKGLFQWDGSFEYHSTCFNWWIKKETQFYTKIIFAFLDLQKDALKSTNNICLHEGMKWYHRQQVQAFLCYTKSDKISSIAVIGL